MREQHPPANERFSSRGGLGSIFDEADDAGRLVTVTSGPYAEQLPVGNASVGEIRARFRDRFDIDPRSVAVLDGHDVNDDTVVRAGQTLMFVHRAGEKGGGGRSVSGGGVSPSASRSLSAQAA